MAVEIERKFLLRSEAWRDQVRHSQWLVQAYLGGERASIRVRIAGDAAFLNIKSRQKGARRLEFEYSIPLDDAEQMLQQLASPGEIRKWRHHVEFDGRLWEIDEFEGDNAGLVVAEIELEAEDADFARPEWLGVEVTEHLRYYNNALAQRPYREWNPEERSPAC